jgi:hypothetical protein
MPEVTLHLPPEQKRKKAMLSCCFDWETYWVSWVPRNVPELSRNVSRIYIRQSLSKDWKLSGIISAIGPVPCFPFTSNVEYFVLYFNWKGKLFLANKADITGLSPDPSGTKGNHVITHTAMKRTKPNTVGNIFNSPPVYSSTLP